MKILREGETTTKRRHFRRFAYADNPLQGRSYDCDERGVPYLYSQEAVESYAACIKGEVNGRVIIDRGVSSYELCVNTPAVGRCDECGADVALDRFISSCPCGADYNLLGQRLAPRREAEKDKAKRAHKKQRRVSKTSARKRA